MIHSPFLAAGPEKAVPRRVAAGVCQCCGWSGQTRLAPPPSLLARDDTADGVCLLCWLWLNLQNQSARSGVLAWLPDLSPENVIHLQREALRQSLSSQKSAQREGRQVLVWLARHRREVRARWKTCSPADFAVLLAETAGPRRAWLRKELTGCALILPPSAIPDSHLLD